MSRLVFEEHRLWAKVEKTETCWLWTASKNQHGYGRFTAYLDGVAANRYAHRVLYELVRGEIPEGHDLDHICHNPPCVNPDHLRPVTRKQNNENRLGANSHSKTGIRGVHWKEGKWEADVIHHSVRHRLGRFTNIADAEAAVIAKRLELFTHNDMDRRAS